MAENGQHTTAANKNNSSQRRLAVIMFTDIAAYTDLMGRDRDRALDLLLKNKELHKELVEKNNGELLKEIGDGKQLEHDFVGDWPNRHPGRGYTATLAAGKSHGLSAANRTGKHCLSRCDGVVHSKRSPRTFQ